MAFLPLPLSLVTWGTSPNLACRHHSALQWFEDNDIQVLVWPSQSPDINPIEHLWVHLKRALLEHPTPPRGVHELWERVEVDWNEIAAETCQNLIENMPRRIQAVIRANGGHTKY